MIDDILPQIPRRPMSSCALPLRRAIADSMTLIVNMLWNDTFVAQVTDRLLATQKGEPFDALTNKTVVYWAKDAIVSMAYTGPAYIGNWPTDSWIAWKLCGKVLDNFLTTGGILIMRHPPVQHQIGQVVRLLEAELSMSELAHLKNAFALTIVGWKWKIQKKRRITGKHKPLQVLWTIAKEKGGPLKAEYMPRKYLPGVRFSTAPDENMSRDKLHELSERIALVAKNFRELSMDDKSRLIENEIVRSIREIAIANPFVGTNCMSVLIAPPLIRPIIRIRFLTEEVQNARRLGMESAPESHEASFRPWIIGPNFIMPPQIFTGEWEKVALGPFTVEIHGRPTPVAIDGERKMVVIGSSGHVRPPRPK